MEKQGFNPSRNDLIILFCLVCKEDTQSCTEFMNNKKYALFSNHTKKLCSIGKLLVLNIQQFIYIIEEKIILTICSNH